MKRVILFPIFLFSLLASFAQESQVKRIPVSYDSTRLNKERQKLLASSCDKAKKERKKILLLPATTTAREQEALFIGKLEKKEVYRVDLSAVVSKYIGETEKNLERIFSNAVNQQWILFFDEADALFGKTKEPASLANYIQKLAQDKNVLTIFWCEDDCLKWMTRLRYVLVQ